MNLKDPHQTALRNEKIPLKNRFFLKKKILNLGKFSSVSTKVQRPASWWMKAFRRNLRNVLASPRTEPSAERPNFFSKLPETPSSTEKPDLSVWPKRFSNLRKTACSLRRWPLKFDAPDKTFFLFFDLFSVFSIYIFYFLFFKRSFSFCNSVWWSPSAFIFFHLPPGMSNPFQKILPTFSFFSGIWRLTIHDYPTTPSTGTVSCTELLRLLSPHLSNNLPFSSCPRSSGSHYPCLTSLLSAIATWSSLITYNELNCFWLTCKGELGAFSLPEPSCLRTEHLHWIHTHTHTWNAGLEKWPAYHALNCRHSKKLSWLPQTKASSFIAKILAHFLLTPISKHALKRHFLVLRHLWESVKMKLKTNFIKVRPLTIHLEDVNLDDAVRTFSKKINIPPFQPPFQRVHRLHQICSKFSRVNCQIILVPPKKIMNEKFLLLHLLSMSSAS